jgi:sec-independent protein translocase protein TatB
MEILGIGPLEFLFIILLALLILGPKDLVKIGKSLGRGLNKLVRSDVWKTAREASDKVRSLPNELMREAGIEDIKQSLNKEVIQPANNARKSIDSLVSESVVVEPEDPQKKPAESPADDPNKILPPVPDKERSK